MDKDKVQAVTEWPIPQTIKELQRFLGFANFYRRFIRKFSLITNRCWGHTFTEVWIETQAFSCDLFSSKLTAAEHNYDIGNREHLAVKLALKEWRHWLEGSIQPFVVLTDHYNLDYISKPLKDLIPDRPSGHNFSLISVFMISNRPRSKNTKLTPFLVSTQTATIHWNPSVFFQSHVFSTVLPGTLIKS